MSDSEPVVRKSKFSLRERRTYLRKFREQAGLSLEELAKLAGLSKSMLSKFELGNRDLSPDAWSRLEKAVVKVLADQKMAALRKQESEKREAAKVEKLAGPFLSLAQMMTPESYLESCKRMEQEYGPHWREVFRELFELSKANADLESRLAELRDLLSFETHKALNESNAQEIRDRVAEREKKETAPKDGDD